MGKRRATKRDKGSDEKFATVVASARDGDHDALAELYRSHVVMVISYFRACQVADAEDLTAETFLGMLRSLARFSGTEDEFRSWLMTIAHRRLVDYLRRGANNQLFLSDQEPVDGRTANADQPVLLDPRLVRALRNLSPAQREVVALRFVADLSLQETATITGRPLTAVKSLQKRGIASLRRAVPDLRVEDRNARSGLSGNLVTP